MDDDEQPHDIDEHAVNSGSAIYSHKRKILSGIKTKGSSKGSII